MTDSSATTGPPLGRVREELGPLRAYTVPAEPPPVKLDANESPWPLPERARETLARRIAELPMHRYPDPRATALREAIATHVHGAPEELVIGAGSDEVIALLVTTLARPHTGADRAVVLYPEPSFVMYRISALAHGLEPVGVPLDDTWDLDVDAMCAAMDEHRPSLVFLATPNNPTGNAFDDERIAAIVEAAGDALVVIDEAYGPFAGRSLSSWCQDHPNVAALGTVSKIGLAAARVGWGRMHPDLAREVDKARQPFNLSALSQAVGVLAFGELAPVLAEHVEAIVRERARLHAALGELPGLRPYPSDANFVLCRYDDDPDVLARALLARNIAVKSFHSHGGRLAHHLRVTVGTPRENDRLLAALRELA